MNEILLRKSISAPGILFKIEHDFYRGDRPLWRQWLQQVHGSWTWNLVSVHQSIAVMVKAFLWKWIQAGKDVWNSDLEFGKTKIFLPVFPAIFMLCEISIESFFWMAGGHDLTNRLQRCAKTDEGVQLMSPNIIMINVIKASLHSQIIIQLRHQIKGYSFETIRLIAHCTRNVISVPY